MQTRTKQHTLYISGEVSTRTLNAVNHRQFVQQCTQNSITQLDFSGVTRADSACLSLLISALRLRSSGRLKINALPSSVLDLARLYEIHDWINA